MPSNEEMTIIKQRLTCEVISTIGKLSDIAMGLGIDRNVIQRITSSFHKEMLTLKGAIIEIITTWDESMGSDATVQKLVKVLKKEGFRKCAEAIERDIMKLPKNEEQETETSELLTTGDDSNNNNATTSNLSHHDERPTPNNVGHQVRAAEDKFMPKKYIKRNFVLFGACFLVIVVIITAVAVTVKLHLSRKEAPLPTSTKSPAGFGNSGSDIFEPTSAPLTSTESFSRLKLDQEISPTVKSKITVPNKTHEIVTPKPVFKPQGYPINIHNPVKITVETPSDYKFNIALICDMDKYKTVTFRKITSVSYKTFELDCQTRINVVNLLNVDLFIPDIADMLRKTSNIEKLIFDGSQVCFRNYRERGWLDKAVFVKLPNLIELELQNLIDKNVEADCSELFEWLSSKNFYAPNLSSFKTNNIVVTRKNKVFLSNLISKQLRQRKPSRIEMVNTKLDEVMFDDALSFSVGSLSHLELTVKSPINTEPAIATLMNIFYNYFPWNTVIDTLKSNVPLLSNKLKRSPRFVIKHLSILIVNDINNCDNPISFKDFLEDARHLKNLTVNIMSTDGANNKCGMPIVLNLNSSNAALKDVSILSQEGFMIFEMEGVFCKYSYNRTGRSIRASSCNNGESSIIRKVN